MTRINAPKKIIQHNVNDVTALVKPLEHFYVKKAASWSVIAPPNKVESC